MNRLFHSNRCERSLSFHAQNPMNSFDWAQSTDSHHISPKQRNGKQKENIHKMLTNCLLEIFFATISRIFRTTIQSLFTLWGIVLVVKVKANWMNELNLSCSDFTTLLRSKYINRDKWENGIRLSMFATYFYFR